MFLLPGGAHAVMVPSRALTYTMPLAITVPMFLKSEAGPSIIARRLPRRKRIRSWPDSWRRRRHRLRWRSETAASARHMGRRQARTAHSKPVSDLTCSSTLDRKCREPWLIDPFRCGKTDVYVSGHRIEGRDADKVSLIGRDGHRNILNRARNRSTSRRKARTFRTCSMPRASAGIREAERGAVSPRNRSRLCRIIGIFVG